MSQGEENYQNITALPELNFNVIHYEVETGKRWKFARLKDKRAFIREDGKEFSHTALYTKYSFDKRIKKHEVDA